MSANKVIAIIAIAVALIGGSVIGNKIFNSDATPSKNYQIAQEINSYRVKHHLHKLTIRLWLTNGATEHSRDMLLHQYFAHTHVTGNAEVIAWGTGGFSTPEGIVSLWRHSPPHKRILLMPSLRYVGVGIAKGNFFGQSDATIVTADFSEGVK